MLLTRIGETRSRSPSTAWGDPDAVANEMAELRERVRSAEAQLERHDQEQEADDADPLPKARYRELANEVERQWREALERIRQLEADRDQWRSRIRSEVEAQYGSRPPQQNEERDQSGGGTGSSHYRVERGASTDRGSDEWRRRDDDNVH